MSAFQWKCLSSRNSLRTSLRFSTLSFCALKPTATVWLDFPHFGTNQIDSIDVARGKSSNSNWVKRGGSTEAVANRLARIWCSLLEQISAHNTQRDYFISYFAYVPLFSYVYTSIVFEKCFDPWSDAFLFLLPWSSWPHIDFVIGDAGAYLDTFWRGGEANVYFRT